MEVVFKADTGEWVVAYDADHRGEIPRYIPIVTDLGDRRVQGLLLEPGTDGFTRIIVSDRIISGSRTLRIPRVVQEGGRGEWRLWNPGSTSIRRDWTRPEAIPFVVQVLPRGRRAEPMPLVEGEALHAGEPR
jgi:hypothetical protein